MVSKAAAEQNFPRLASDLAIISAKTENSHLKVAFSVVLRGRRKIGYLPP